MAISTFDGPVRSLNGFYSQGNGNILTLGATVTLSVATHAGHICWFRPPARLPCRPLLLLLTRLALAPVLTRIRLATLALRIQLVLQRNLGGCFCSNGYLRRFDVFVGSLGVIGTTVDITRLHQ
jgi:hypothetical protein